MLHVVPYGQGCGPFDQQKDRFEVSDGEFMSKKHNSQVLKDDHTFGV